MEEKRSENGKTDEAIAHGHRFACNVVCVIVTHTSKRLAIILLEEQQCLASSFPTKR